MKMIFVLVLFYCAILKSAISLPVEDVGSVNVRQTKLKINLEKSAGVKYEPNVVKSLKVNKFYDKKNSNHDDTFFLKTKSLGKADKKAIVSRITMEPSYEKKENGNSLTAETHQYFFLSDVFGKAIIIDEEYKVVASYELPELEYGIGAIVDNKFYNIDTEKGQIISTDIENLMTFGNVIEWDTVGSFPSERNYMRHQVAVNESSIYFMTHSGILYSFDSLTKTTTRIGYIDQTGDLSFYAALLIAEQTLYIHKGIRFYSFDGITFNEISVPSTSTRNNCGLFQLGNHVCFLGGNITEIFPDPVPCYDPISGQWSVDATSDEFIWYPGVATANQLIYVFGGVKYFYNATLVWSTTCFVLNLDGLFLSYIQCPFSETFYIPQVISFLH